VDAGSDRRPGGKWVRLLFVLVRFFHDDLGHYLNLDQRNINIPA